jgi:hypothetical protein
MVLLIIGITLYMYGYLRREAQPPRVGVIFLSLFVILWGVFTYFVAASALTAWDFVGFWIWEIKGILGIGTGPLLFITSLLKRHAQQTQNWILTSLGTHVWFSFLRNFASR